MIILYRLTRSVVLYGVSVNILIVFTLVVSIVTWNAFLQNKHVDKLGQTLDNYISQSLNKNAEMLRGSPVVFGKDLVKRYLAACNFFIYDISQDSIITEPSLTRAWENNAIAYSMFNSYGSANLLGVPEIFSPYVNFFATENFPPLWLNAVEQSMEIKSNFLFTTTYLLLPLIVLASAISWYRRKDSIASLMLILASSSFLNVLMHLFILPADRYLFWGYPINLIICAFFIVKIIQIASLLLERKHLLPLSKRRRDNSSEASKIKVSMAVIAEKRDN
jgi:hypothetical protein